jgi:hypothetical protein
MTAVGGNMTRNNTVDGDVLVNNNFGFEGIFYNLIGHTLECNDNTPPPARGQDCEQLLRTVRKPNICDAKGRHARGSTVKKG